MIGEGNGGHGELTRNHHTDRYFVMTGEAPY